MPLFLLLLTIPLIEIGLFIAIGGEIGLWPTLAVVVITAIVGAAAIRSQGKSVLKDLGRLDDPKKATAAVLNGAFIVVAGLLLLTPGFLTDSIGLSLLVPPVRAWIARRLAGRIRVAAMTGAGMGGARPGGSDPSDHPGSTDGRSGDASAGPRKPVGRPMADADDAVVLDRRDDGAS